MINDPTSRAYSPTFCFKIPNPELQLREILDPEKPIGDLPYTHIRLYLLLKSGEKKFYSRVPITRTLTNSNLALTRTKILHSFTTREKSFSLVYYNFTLPLTRRNFCFDPSDHFYINLTSITRTKRK